VKRAWDSTPSGLFALAWLIAALPVARAAEWSIAPTLTVSVDHDSNRYLEPDGPASDGTAMSLDLQFKYATERLSLALHPQASLEHFDSAAYPSTHDLALGGSANYATERSSFSLTGLLSDTTLGTTELVNTGIVEPGTRRHDESASGGWSFSETERLSLILQASYSHSIYTTVLGFGPDGAAATALESYDGATVSASEQYQYSDRIAAFVSLSQGGFTQAGVTAQTNTTGLVAGFKSQLSERFTFNADAGASRTTFETLTSTGFLADVSVSRSTLTGSFSLGASRSVAPAGFGEVTTQDTLRASAQRTLTARLSGDLGVSVFRYTSVFNDPHYPSLTLVDRTYSQVTAGLTYQLSETWSVGLHGLATRLQGESVPSADDWQVGLVASWSPRPLSLSR
jgi:hypothetical protein